MYTPSHRRRSAWLLLAVFVPMLLFSSLHHHAEPSQVACTECVQHLPHAGHLSAASVGWDHCLLCQLLTLAFLPGLVRMMLAEERSISKPMGALRHLLQKRFACCAIPRAPSCTLIGLSVGTDLLWRGRKVAELFLCGENLTDRVYQPHLSRLKYMDRNVLTGQQGICNPGRSFTIKICVPF